MIEASQKMCYCIEEKTLKLTYKKWRNKYEKTGSINGT